MAIATISRRRVRLHALPLVRSSAPSRDWFSTSQAALLLGTSERTLRRRISRRSWREGLHYRWITRQTRQTLEINVPQAIKLMNTVGWS
jgi:3-deoxy-D-arabino-heptulosonate 7-phosphate (DAHP) synthase class II